MLTNNRAQRAYELINQGITGNELIQKLCLEFSLAGYGADQAVKEAMLEIASEKATVKSELTDLEDHIGRREQIYERAIALNDSELALKALGDIAKLQGIYEIEKDNKIQIEFMYPDIVSYKPLTREEMERMRQMMMREDLKKIEAHVELGADIDTGEKDTNIEGSNTV